MKLYEIIEAFEDGKKAVLVELLTPYKKSLIAYYTDLFTSEPILMVTAVTNTTQYAIIVPSGEFEEAIQEYHDNEATEEDIELISFLSVMLKDF